MGAIKKSWIIIAAVVLLVIITISSYNGMVTKEQGVKKQWANVESSYQRRADLIPNLVNTVKGYAEHEKSTLTEVIQARANATKTSISVDNLSPSEIQKFQAAQSQVGSALGKLMVIAEKYPDLKANQNFLELQAQLEGTENRINVERNRFNEVVELFNNKVLTFPSNLMAKMFGFKEKGFFEAQKGSEVAPTVKF